MIRKDPQSGGMWSWSANQWREKFGSDSPLQDLRREYVRIRNQGLLADLPPGPASDKDIATREPQMLREQARVDAKREETLERYRNTYGVRVADIRNRKDAALAAAHQAAVEHTRWCRALVVACGEVVKGKPFEECI